MRGEIPKCSLLSQRAFQTLRMKDKEFWFCFHSSHGPTSPHEILKLNYTNSLIRINYLTFEKNYFDLYFYFKPILNGDYVSLILSSITFQVYHFIFVSVTLFFFLYSSDALPTLKLPSTTKTKNLCFNHEFVLLLARWRKRLTGSTLKNDDKLK